MRLPLLALFLSIAAHAAPFTGRVTERLSKKPVASVEVNIRKAGAPFLMAEIDTDSTGRFRGPDLPPGDYLIELNKPNFMPLSLHVKEGANLNLTLTRYGLIAGRVTDAKGQPVPNAAVITLVAQSGGGFAKLTESAVFTDPRGQFRIAELAPGRYAVAVSYQGGAGNGLHFYPSDSQPQTFTIAAGEDFRDVNFAITPQPLFSISGTVQPSGEKNSFYGVTLIARDRPWYSIAQQTQVRAGTPFRFEGIPNGSYDLVAVAPAAGYGFRSVVPGPNPMFGRTQVAVTGGNVDDVTISLTPARTATVLFESAARECMNGEILLRPAEDLGVIPGQPVKAAEGNAVTIPRLAPGKYRIEFNDSTNQCYAAAPVSIDLTDSTPEQPVTLKVDAAGSIDGHLTGTSNPSQFEVSLAEVAGLHAAVLSRAPDAQGRFQFEGLRPGRYRIWVNETSLEVSVPAGRAVPLNISAPAPAQ